MLRKKPHVDLSWSVLDGRLGETDGATVIRLHPHQSQVQRRCTLAHELAHIELGHTAGCNSLEEKQATQLAARWLITMPMLLDALRWTEELEEAADILWVDMPTLMARLDGLTGKERAMITDLYQSVEKAP